MRLMLAALVATAAIAIVAAVFAIWPVVGDAPWEDETANRTAELRCEGALAYRVSVIEAGEFSAGQFGGSGRPARRTSSDPIAAVPGNPSGLVEYDKALADAEAEIRRYC